MTTIVPSLRERSQSLYGWSPVMIRMAAVCAAFLVGAMAGMLVDDRQITGAPLWLKPAKFGASGAIYLVTLTWMMRELPRTRTVRVATSLIAWILAAETAVVAVQAARGMTSHFNINTALDAAIYSAMGIGIATLWVLSAVLLWIHLRTPAVDRSMALALRIGLALNIAGAGVGWTMTQPRSEQFAALQRGERPFVAGAHTVGAADGGLGLPLTKWSRTHGDLRVPHFVGMHAWQLLPLLLLGIRRVRSATDDVMERAVIIFASTVCLALFIGALIQALAGHPLVSLSPS